MSEDPHNPTQTELALPVSHDPVVEPVADIAMIFDHADNVSGAGNNANRPSM